MSLFFNILSRFFIVFLPKSKHLLISGLQSSSAGILEPKEINSATVSIISPSICYDAMILIFWMVSFMPVFSPSSFTFIKRLFSSSLYAIRMVLSVYLRLLIFLLEILIQLVLYLAWHFTWCTIYKLNKHGDNIQPNVLLSQFEASLLFHVWFCCSLICIHIFQEAGKVISYSHLFQNFPQIVVIHTVKGFAIVNKAEVDIFLKFYCLFYDPTDVGNLISGSSAFSKSSLNIWKFSVHVMLKPALENFEHNFTSVWDECNCAAVWAFFGISFLWDWNTNKPFTLLWPLLSFSKFSGTLSVALSQHHLLGFEIVQLYFCFLQSFCS